MRSNYCSLESGLTLRSTLPRPKTEAATYLNLYKLTIEKKRLEHELESIEVRRHRIQKRLTFLGSPYVLEQFIPKLPSNVPYVFTYGQMQSAQAIALSTLLKVEQSI